MTARRGRLVAALIGYALLLAVAIVAGLLLGGVMLVAYMRGIQ